MKIHGLGRDHHWTRREWFSISAWLTCFSPYQPHVETVAQIAQLVEQGIENPRVGGSNPPLGTIFLTAGHFQVSVSQ